MDCKLPCSSKVLIGLLLFLFLPIGVSITLLPRPFNAFLKLQFPGGPTGADVAQFFVVARALYTYFRLRTPSFSFSRARQQDGGANFQEEEGEDLGAGPGNCGAARVRACGDAVARPCARPWEAALYAWHSRGLRMAVDGTRGPSRASAVRLRKAARHFCRFGMESSYERQAPLRRRKKHLRAFLGRQIALANVWYLGSGSHLPLRLTLALSRRESGVFMPS